MKIDDNMIVHLNRLLNDELLAVNQYFLHSKIFSNWGLDRLHDLEHKECMDELDHASLYAKRILFLEGTLTVGNFDTLKIKHNIEDILRIDLQLEYHSVKDLRDSIEYCDSVQDHISKEIMVTVLKDEEKHIHFLETELDLIKKIGIHNYIQSQLKSMI